MAQPPAQGPVEAGAGRAGDTQMLWVVVTTIVLAGFQFDEQLASLEIYNTAEINLLVGGTLVGLALGFLVRKIEAI
jgi:hypothetical protein